MQTCKRGHPPEEIHICPSGKPTCKACARERYRAKRETINAKRRHGEYRTAHDVAQVAKFKAANDAGLLDKLLMLRAGYHKEEAEGE